MKRFLFISVFCSFFTVFSQTENNWFFDAHFYQGTILRHNKDVAHLIRKHPSGVIIGLNKRTFGDERWHHEYNFPDYGVSFVSQFSGNPTLGDSYGIHGHFNFYFFNRNLLFRIGQGIAYNTNPFDLETNFKNNAYGSHLLNSTYVFFNFKRQQILKNFGIQAGFGLLHYSNGNFKAPNTSTNTLFLNVGIDYETSGDKIEERKRQVFESFTQPIKLNFVLRGGFNESDYVGLGQHPFVVFSAFVDKRISYKSSLQLGSDLFLATALKEEIKYLSASELDSNITGEEDWKRVGFFLGHELHFDKLSVVSQLGYYAYYPYDFNGRIYIRAGLKYYFSNKLFSEITLKSHGGNIENVEFGIGYRL